MATTHLPPIDREVTQIHRAMQAVQKALRPLEACHEPHLANALLNLAVTRMIEETSAKCTAQVLNRLAEMIRTYPAPPPELAIDLSSFNA